MIRVRDVKATEAELGKVRYTVVPANKTVLDELETIEAEFAEADDTAAVVKGLCALIDVRLEAPEGKPAASEIVGAMWDDGEITLPQIRALLEDIARSDRPT